MAEELPLFVLWEKVLGALLHGCAKRLKRFVSPNRSRIAAAKPVRVSRQADPRGPRFLRADLLRDQVVRSAS